MAEFVNRPTVSFGFLFWQGAASSPRLFKLVTLAEALHPLKGGDFVWSSRVPGV
jgi:hypothetical protein